MSLIVNCVGVTARAVEIDKLGLVLLKEKRLLVARSKGKDIFYIPGGKREVGETDLEALTREIREELSVDLIVDSIKYIGTFESQAHGRDSGVTVKLTVYTGDYEGNLSPNSEIEELAWVEIKDKDRCSEVTQKVMDSLGSTGLM